MNRLIAAAAIVGATACALDGPTMPIRANGYAAGWSGSTANGQYEIGVDSGARNGTAAGYLLSVTMNPTFATMHQRIRADDYRGRRLRLSAWVRHRMVESAGLWMRVDGFGKILAFDNMSRRPVRDSWGWHYVSVVLDVDSAAVGIALGVLMTGRGELVVDDMVLEVVGSNVPVTAQFLTPFTSGDSATTAAAYEVAPRSPVNLDFEGAAGMFIHAQSPPGLQRPRRADARH